MLDEDSKFMKFSIHILLIVLLNQISPIALAATLNFDGPVSELERSRGVIFALDLVSKGDGSFFELLWDLYTVHDKSPLDIYVIGSEKEVKDTFDEWVGKPLDIVDYEKVHRIHVINEDMAKHKGMVLKWVRDYGPLFKRSSGEIVTLDFEYSKKGLQQFVDLMVEQNQIPNSQKVPLLFEGGNFEVDSDKNCLVSKTVLKKNQLHSDSEKNRGAIRKLFRDMVGCRNLNFISTVPHEMTGHIDTWMKYLGNNTFVVADVGEKTVQAQKRYFPEGLSKLHEIRAALTVIQQELIDLGYQIKKLPIFPIYDDVINIGNRKTMNTTVYMSFTNSLYFNGTLYSPSYRWLQYSHVKSNYPENTFKLFDEIENEAHTILASLPIVKRVVPLRSDRIVRFGGSIHCLTLQLPAEP